MNEVIDLNKIAADNALKGGGEITSERSETARDILKSHAENQNKKG